MHISPKKLGKRYLQSPILDFAKPIPVCLQEGFTVNQALEYLRDKPLEDQFAYLYVVDSEDRLCGVVPVRRILSAKPEDHISGLMQKRIISLSSAATVMDACEFFMLHRLLALPLVDENHVLKGIVDVSLFAEEMAGAGEQRVGDELFQLIGVHVQASKMASPWLSFKGRFPWLLCNVGGGITCALISSRYESLLATAVTLALFIPVVLALAESVSIQSMTLTLQRLHAGQHGWTNFFRAIFRELGAALLLGMGTGSVVGVICWLWRADPGNAIAIGTAISLAVGTAGTLGVALPTLVKSLRFDPKVAAGPMVLALTDVATLFYYFSLALAISKYF